MEISVGAILEGTIKSITKFGAFVSLPGGRSGLVHISEIAHSYVANVSDFLSEGQAVKVKVVSIDEAGRINLSIKKATPPPPRPQGSARDRQGRSDFRGEIVPLTLPTPESPEPPRPSPPAPPILRPGSSSSCRPLTAGCPT
ncbi:MAG: S1 RNA-binding domain-containing protein [Evtepia gabavorous]